MKDFITAIASVIILMLFLAQFSASQLAYVRMVGVENAANKFAANYQLMMLMDEGERNCAESVDALRREVAEITGCELGKVSANIVCGSYNVDSLTISAPIKDMVAFRIPGMSEKRDRTYTSRRTLVYELPEKEAEGGTE